MATLWCPEWPTVAAGVAPDEPAAVFHAGRVIARTPAAITAGVRAGLLRRAAQRICPELEVLDHDPDRDARAFEPVIRAVIEMAPRLEIVAPGWLCLAARGPSRYFGGDRPFAERLVAHIADLAHVSAGCSVLPGVGVADGRSASAIAARRAARGGDGTGGVVVVPAGGSRAYVAGMSIEWLREIGDASADLVDLFLRLGLRTMGDLAALSPADVLARFGGDGVRSHRVASGDDSRLAAAVDPAPEWWVEELFDEPVEQLETVVFVAKRLADLLAARLAADGRVCSRLVVIVETEHGERSERAWYRDGGLSAVAMVERARWQLEGWVDHPAGLTGGIALIRLIPDEVRGDDGTQVGMWGGRTQADLDAARAVARLTGLAGEQSVLVPAWVGGRLPGDRYRWTSAASADLEHPEGRLDQGGQPWPGALPAPSPAIVPLEPIPIEVTDADGAPVRVTGRGVVSAAPAVILARDGPQQIEHWSGPWPVDQRWWTSGRHRRLARFQVVTEQGHAHLLAIEQQHWSILATYA